MQTIQLNVADGIYKQALEMSERAYNKYQSESRYEYIDSIGDVIEVIGNKESVIPSKHEIKLLSESIDKENYISSEEARKLLLNV